MFARMRSASVLSNLMSTSHLFDRKRGKKNCSDYHVVVLYRPSSDDIFPLPSRRVHLLYALCGVWLRRVLIRRDKRIWILWLQVSQGMIDLAMFSLISSDIQQEILHRPPILGHLPIADSKIRDCEGRVGPLRQLPSLNVLNRKRICQDGFLLEISDEAVAGSWRDEIRQEHAIKKDALGTEDHHAHEPAGLGHLEERKQMHALVISLFKQRLDPAMISF